MAPGRAPVFGKVDPKKWEGKPEGEELEEHLIRMGCNGLYEKPWDVPGGKYVEELVTPGNPRGPLRSNPKAWTGELWRKVYSFAKENWEPGVDQELLSKYVEGVYNPSECYRSNMFKDEGLRRVVGFLNPIFHPNRSERVTARLATAYIQAFYGFASPDWGELMEEMVTSQVRRIRDYPNSKTFLAPYILHLYESCECLEQEEKELWQQLVAPRNRISSPRGKKSLAILPKEASSSRVPRKRLNRSSSPPRKRLNRSPSPPRKKPSLAEKVNSLSREVTRKIEDMEGEVMEARSLHRTLRKMFGWEEEEDILYAARETRRKFMKMKKELRVHQEERREVGDILKMRTGSTLPERGSPRSRRRYAPPMSISSDEESMPIEPRSRRASPSSSEENVRVYKRKKDLPVNSSGGEPGTSSLLQEESHLARAIIPVDISTTHDPTPYSPEDVYALPEDIPPPPVDISTTPGSSSHLLGVATHPEKTSPEAL